MTKHTSSSYLRFSLVLLVTTLTASSAHPTEFVPGAIVIRFKPASMPSPETVSVTEPRFGIAALDVKIVDVEGEALVKYLPTYNTMAAGPGDRLERSFVLYYAGSLSPQDVAAQFMLFPEVEVARPIPAAETFFFGTVRYIPIDHHFNRQWSLDTLDVSGDRVDIDAPEAWGIERGVPDVVIGIVDSGTGVFRFENPWILHPDFDYYFNPAEDKSPYEQMSDSDIDNIDDSLPGSADADTLRDNVFGYNTELPPRGTSEAERQVWRALPHNGIPTEDVHDGLRLQGHYPHGLAVASIAAAREGGAPNDAGLLGVAPGSQVYHVRVSTEGVDPTDETLALLEAMTKSSVINMSIGFYSYPGDDFVDAIQTATDPNGYDCIVVAASGNRDEVGAGGQILTAWPGRLPEVLCVGNMNSDLTLYEHSQYGPDVGFVDCVAPVGTGIPVHNQLPCSGADLTLMGDCQKEYGYRFKFNGTSAASPQVAGIAALVRARFPNLDNTEVKARVENACQWFWSEPPSDDDQKKFGNGKANAYRALTEWGSIPTNTTWSSTSTRDGKYYISGDLTIESGATLTIEPGVVVKVAPDHEEAGSDPTRVRIIVKSGGALNIAGTAANKVTFESFTDSPATSDDWSGILFEAGSSGSISHAVFKNAERAIEAHAPLVLNDCTFIDSEVAIDAWANVAANRTIIADNTAALCAVDLHGVGGGFTNCTFANNAGAAVGIRHNGSTLFNKCVAAFNGGPAVRVIDGTTTAVVGSSVLYGNTAVSGSLSDEQWVTEGDNVIHQDPAFCDAAEGDYTLFAFSPAAAGPYFMERAGALDIACVPSAAVAATPSVVAACPVGDGLTELVVSVDLDNAVMTRTVGADEIRLDIDDLSASVFEEDGIVSAGTNAVAPDYITSIEHSAFGGCSQGEAVDVLLNGTPLAQQATVTIRSPDLDGSGWVNVIDYAAFTNGYPVDPAINDCRDFNNDSKVQIVDFSYFSAHNGHYSPYSPANAPREIFQSSASVALGFTEEYPTATTHRLYVDVDVENFGNVTTALFAVAPGSNRLTFLEWQTAGESLGTVMCTGIHRDGIDQVYIGAAVSETFTGSTARLGRIVLDVEGLEPFEVTEDHFYLTAGEVLLDAAGEGPVVAHMAGAFGRALDPAVARIYHNRLEQNFPNPFNPTTTLAYSIKNGGHVNLTIYDVAGRRVRELVNERRERGAFNVVWNGQNEAGQRVASGVYFYKLVAGSFTDTKKMTILK